MKKIVTLLVIVLLIAFVHGHAIAQERTYTPEKFGNTLNLGVGLGYYGYAPGVIPAFTVNYEFDVARSFTVAPFITAYTYRNYYYWGDANTPYRDYYYHRTVVPIGAKATYYFDELFKAGPKWDFYAAGSVGAALVTTSYEDGYNGERGTYNGISPLYIDAHLGSEFHLTNTVGIYLDLSTGLSTFGLALHL